MPTAYAHERAITYSAAREFIAGDIGLAVGG